MADIQDKIRKAKDAGYSDDEIISHISSIPEYQPKIKMALDAQYSPNEILSHLSNVSSKTAPVSQSAPAVPEQPQQADIADKIMGSAPVRLALGAATPIVGAFQAGANVGDYLNKNFLGQEPTVGPAVAEWWNRVQQMKERGMQAAPGVVPGIKPVDVAGALGSVGTAGTIALPRTIGQQMALGAGLGAATPGAKDLGETGTSAAAGGLLALAVPGVAKGAGWLYDAATGRLAQVQAGKILREAAGPKLDELRRVMSGAPEDVNAAQAAYGVDRDVWQALGDLAKRKDLSNYYQELSTAQEAGRKSALEGATPNLAATIAEREAKAAPLYEAAKQKPVTLDKDFMDIMQRMPSGTLNKAAEIARMEGRPFQTGEYIPAHQVETGVLDASGKPVFKDVPAQYPSMTGEDLHYVRRALKDIATAAPSAQGIGRDAQDAARGVLTDFTKKMETEIPAYGQARQTFAEGSRPVSQSKTLNELSNILERPSGGERTEAFLNALGRGQESLLKKTTGYARYEQGDLEKVLTPDQMNTVTKIATDVKRDTELARDAIAGREKLSRILDEATMRFRLPTLLRKEISITNKTLDILEDQVNKKTLNTLIDGMKTGKSAVELMDQVPAKDRNLVLKAMVQSNMWTPEAVKQINALAEPQENRNKLRSQR